MPLIGSVPTNGQLALKRTTQPICYIMFFIKNGIHGKALWYMHRDTQKNSDILRSTDNSSINYIFTLYIALNMMELTFTII